MQTLPDEYNIKEALLAVAGRGGSVNGKRLSAWLRKHTGRYFNGLKLCEGERDLHAKVCLYYIARQKR